MATGRRGVDAGLTRANHVELAIAERSTLSSEQKTMGLRICGSGDLVEVVPRVAVSDTTHPLAAASAAWLASGRTVIGATLSAQAARQLQQGSDIPGPFAYAEESSLAHGYAMTIHKAQCTTCDHALVLVCEAMPREAIYTAMSRGRQRNDLYLVIDTGRGEIAHASEVTRDAIGAFASGIERSDAQQMAIASGGLSL